MTIKRTNQINGDLDVDSSFVVDEAVVLGGAVEVKGATTFTSTLSTGGAITLNSITLVQTLGGTDFSATGIWGTSNAPVLTIGNSYFVLTAGSSTFRVACFPTT